MKKIFNKYMQISFKIYKFVKNMTVSTNKIIDKNVIEKAKKAKNKAVNDQKVINKDGHSKV